MRLRCGPFALLLLAFSSAAAPAQSTIFIVRHAEKADASAGDVKDPDLSENGRAWAASLAAVLTDAKLTAIFATEYKRTQQTAEPVARAVNIRVTTVPANDGAALVAKLKEVPGNALVIGHSNTIPELVRDLGAAALFKIEERDYDNLFVVVCAGAAPQLIQLHLPVPAAEGTSQAARDD